MIRLLDLVQPLFAVVNSDGTLARGRRVTAATKIGGFTGAYEVVLDRDVTGCVCAATVGQTAAGSAVGEATVASRALIPNGMFVATHNSDGTLADKPFHLLVNC